MRLDQFLSQTLGSRTRAQDAIEAGRICVNGKIITKASTQVEEQDDIQIAPAEHDYVSRAGGKLLAAIEAWDIDLKDKVVLDIGASTGGFTQCCLEHGAVKVYALDVGHLQLSPSLQNNSRVVQMEGVNAKEIQADWFDPLPDFVCMDVSFISCLSILEPLFEQFVPESMVILIKPQFEAGKAQLKNGVVKNPSARRKVLENVSAFLETFYNKIRTMESPVPGRKGNLEFLAWCSRPKKLKTEE